MRTGWIASIMSLAAVLPVSAQPWFRGVGFFPGGANGVANEVSADGRYAVFNSLTGNLVQEDTNGRSDVFLHDLRKPQ